MRKCILFSGFFSFLFSMGLFAQPIYSLSDPKATRGTQFLYASMQRLIGAGVLFGHHDDLAYGVGWRGDANRSDVQTVTGDLPAVYGWDLARLETGSPNDINSIPFKRQAQFVKDVYKRGGINTFCWHLNNPVNGKTAWDTSENTVKQIIPGGMHHQEFVAYLDKIAAYLKTLKGEQGEAIPILFRPFHELTGNWFWWGKNTCTPQEFKSLWRFTTLYLRDKKKLHNLIMVYSTAGCYSEAQFLERYPGDDVVDVMGFDDYCDQNVDKYAIRLDKQLSVLQQIGAKRHKVISLPETGFVLLPQANWWTNVLLPIISKYKLSYMMLWRNGGPEHFYVPYPGQQSANDFKIFAQNNNTMFQKRIKRMEVYGREREFYR
jgi:mannan endo-1,4-beta-mannosidase